MLEKSIRACLSTIIRDQSEVSLEQSRRDPETLYTQILSNGCSRARIDLIFSLEMLRFHTSNIYVQFPRMIKTLHTFSKANFHTSMEKQKEWNK